MSVNLDQNQKGFKTICNGCGQEAIVSFWRTYNDVVIECISGCHSKAHAMDNDDDQVNKDFTFICNQCGEPGKFGFEDQSTEVTGMGETAIRCTKCNNEDVLYSY